MYCRAHRATLRLVVLLALAAVSAGCDSLLSTSDRRPDRARVVVTGTSGVPLRLITSTRFTAQPNPQTGVYDVFFDSFESADVELPQERTVRLDTDRFIVRLLHPSEEGAASVLLEVFFDGRLAYSQEADLVDSYIDFIQVFN